MDKELSKLRGKIIPIIDWKFFSSTKKASEHYNENTFNGWNEQWIPIGSNQFGDAIALNNNGNIGVVEHDTDEPAQFTLITRDTSKFTKTISSLLSMPKYSEDSSVKKLNKILKELRNIKNTAPNTLKEELKLEIDDIKYIIEDKKEDERDGNTDWEKTLEILREYALKMGPIIDKHACFSDVVVSGITSPPTITYVGTVKNKKEKELLKKIASDHPAPYTIDFQHLNIDSEKNKC